MAKKILMSQFGNLTPNHKRLKKGLNHLLIEHVYEIRKSLQMLQLSFERFSIKACM
jgi:hypothetical protein